MYLLYVDESGSHGTLWDNRAYVLAGLAVHERDVPALGRALHDLVAEAVPKGSDPAAFELHAAELRKPGDDSPWDAIDGQVRRRLLERALRVIADFTGADPARPPRLLVEVLPAGERLEREAYGRLLNRFDDWLVATGDDLGLVLSDASRRDREIQEWADDWREAAGPWGRLDRLVEVPLFADSRASRLLQAADLVAWSSWRHFGQPKPDDHWWDLIAPGVDVAVVSDRNGH